MTVNGIDDNINRKSPHFHDTYSLVGNKSERLVEEVWGLRAEGSHCERVKQGSVAVRIILYKVRYMISPTRMGIFGNESINNNPAGTIGINGAE